MSHEIMNHKIMGRLSVVGGGACDNRKVCLALSRGCICPMAVLGCGLGSDV